MRLRMREARGSDVESLRALMQDLNGHQLSTQDMIGRLQFVEGSKADWLFVCEADGQAAGLLGFRIRENLEEASRFGEVPAIVVSTDERGKGVGRFMMDYAEKLASEMGCIGTWLVSGFGREEPAHAFYKTLGYEITGYRFVKRF